MNSSLLQSPLFCLLLNHDRSFLSLGLSFHSCEMGKEVGAVAFPSEVSYTPGTHGL